MSLKSQLKYNPTPQVSPLSFQNSLIKNLSELISLERQTLQLYHLVKKNLEKKPKKYLESGSFIFDV